MQKTGSNLVRLSLVILICITLLTLVMPRASADESLEIKTISLGVGRTETERNITWHTNSAIAGKVQYAKKSGEAFPSDYSQVDAVSVQAENDEGYFINKVTISDLKPETEYVYRFVHGEAVSCVYSFKTDGTGNFSFILVGDPQIGASDLRIDAARWEYMLDSIMRKFPDSNLLVSLGDQVDDHGDETQYAAYFAPSAMQTLTNATVVGNHDTGSVAYSEHFNNPNTVSSDEQIYGTTTAGCDYWYVYNNTLFLNLNTNNTNTEEHKVFMENAVAENPDVDWRIVVMHHSLFSAADHAFQEDIIQRRNELVPVFTELDIDLVLAGHDHVYVRTHMMNGLTPDTSLKGCSSVAGHPGICYITANSSTGSKYYHLLRKTDLDLEYVGFSAQDYVASFSRVEVTKDSLKITTYQTENMSVVDSFEICKAEEANSILDNAVWMVLIFAAVAIIIVVLVIKRTTSKKH